MPAYYFDTSTLVKRYFQEVGTAWVRSITNPLRTPNIYIVRITGPEIVAAFFLKARTGEITHSEAVAASNRFKGDLISQYLILEVTTGVIDRAMMLAEQHNLRGYDSVQLAAASELHVRLAHVRLATDKLDNLIFISADNGLNRIAEIEGLEIDNPNTHM